MIEPQKAIPPPPTKSVDRLQLAVSDKLMISAEGRLAIVVSAIIVLAVAFLWTR